MLDGNVPIDATSESNVSNVEVMLQEYFCKVHEARKLVASYISSIQARLF